MSIIRAASTLVAFLVLTSIAGCDRMNVEDAKAQVRELHERRLQYLLDRDAASFVATLGPEVVDLGGGASGTGELPREYYSVAYWQEWFASEEFNRVMAGKTLGQLVRINDALVYTYPEVKEKGLDGFGEGTLYRPEDDDIWISFPPAESSLLTDGWFGVYRKIQGAWKVVGVD